MIMSEHNRVEAEGDTGVRGRLIKSLEYLEREANRKKFGLAANILHQAIHLAAVEKQGGYDA